MPLVVKLKISELEMAASVITRNSASERAPRQVEGASWRRFAGGASSRGATRANSAAQASEMGAGTAKAARQPAYFTRKPVRMAAPAMPRFPASPLRPIVKPGLRAALHDHRDADGMVDRREDTHEREHRGGCHRFWVARDEKSGEPHAQEEDDHHSPAAPEVAEPARRERSDPEHDERADRVRHEVRSSGTPQSAAMAETAAAKIRRMIQCVSRVQEQSRRGSERRTGRGVHGGATVAHRLAACQTRCLPVVAGTSWR